MNPVTTLRSAAVLLTVSALVGFGQQASAAPVSGCALTPGGDIHCDIITGSGVANDPVALPSGSSETAGYVVLLQSGGSFSDPTTWNSVAYFQSNGTGFASTVQLLTQDVLHGSSSVPNLENSGPVDLGFRPDLLLVDAASSPTFSIPSFTFALNGGFDSFTVTTVPLPPSFVLLGSSLLGLLVLRRRIEAE